ncbi:MAG: DUF3644 domain-containing protein [Planctomycetota bacterium]
MSDEPSQDDIELAQRLLAEWDGGKGKAKSRIEIETWNDATSHGRHFDRFIRTTLGIQTTRPSRQSDRIALLESQVRGLGALPVGTDEGGWEVQLHHARASCLAAIRTWNDPTAPFRTGSFALLFVTAWNSLAIAIAIRDGIEWRKLDKEGSVKVHKGVEQARDTSDLVGELFSGSERRGLRENVQFWIDLRNAVAHRHLPSLDLPVIPWAQSGLLNFETQMEEEFGKEFILNDQLSVPLQLSGFRDPGVLASRKKLQADLPLDVQAILSRADNAPPELLEDLTYMMRVAFVPVVPTSGRNPDAISYFVKPGEVPTELAEMLDQYVVLPKVPGGRPNHNAMHVIGEVTRRTGFRFNTQQHLLAARALGARPPAGEPEATVDIRYAEYITSFKRHLYSQAWIDRLVEELSTAEGFEAITGKPPVAV